MLTYRKRSVKTNIPITDLRFEEHTKFLISMSRNSNVVGYCWITFIWRQKLSLASKPINEETQGQNPITKNRSNLVSQKHKPHVFLLTNPKTI